MAGRILLAQHQQAIRRLSLTTMRRSFVASARSNAAVLGLLRETYNVWERRTPLCPEHVEKLLNRPGSPVKEVLVQPSSSRVFSDTEYQRAGAILQEDLSRAELILGVKRPLTTDFLYPQKAYMFFSHVIKGQPENMPLLQYILDNKIKLFDYECIVAGGLQATENCTERKQKRLVAFGKFAGRAGMVDAFNPLGRRLLALGCSTPLLHCPPAHMHKDWDAVQETVKRAGECIATDGLASEPIIFCFTGKGGNVHSGAMEVFSLLPHEMIEKEDLAKIRAKPGPHKCVYGLSLGTKDLVRRYGGLPFDRQHYQEHPQEYEPIFYKEIAPYVNVIVNGMYWDERYPRLLTKKQMQKLYTDGNKELMVVADISCDVHGSIEFLDRTTNVDSPYFQYDPILKREVSEQISSNGVTMMGVDILPTELPRDSSKYFGDALLPVLEKYLDSKDSQASSQLSELMNACIAANGSLTPDWQHLESFLKHPSSKLQPIESKATLFMEGHLFDSGFINHALNIIEQNESHFEIVECHVRRNQGGNPIKSHVIIRIGAQDDASVDRIEKQIRSLMDVMESAECSMQRLDHNEMPTKSTMAPPTAIVTDLPKKEKVLVLGSGLVSKTLVEYLGRDRRREVTVVGAIEAEARAVSKAAKNGRHLSLDIQDRMDRVAKLIEESDIVVSLLPAPMHPVIANACIDKSTDLVTASYESDAMRQLDERAKSKGVRILNEVGLDPGLDHMSAMKMIDDIHVRGGVVTGFTSVCGGLPSPEAANNPLMYKFSWSPMGVLSACQNDAVYRVDNKTIKANGKQLLRHAEPFADAWPALRLECLPNRNSLVYESKYGIPLVETLFRGTLRYGGFSGIMSVFQSMGLLNADDAYGLTWSDVIYKLQRRAGVDNFDDFLLHCANGSSENAARAAECLDFLDMRGDAPIAYPDNLVASFCETLATKCRFEENERDMVLMHTSIQAAFEDGVHEEHRSSLQAYGDAKGSAMSKTVGYTAAAATEVLLNEKAATTGGLLLPTTKELYLPILKALETEGVKFKEDIRVDDAKHLRSVPV